jgi:hypothetical protein
MEGEDCERCGCDGTIPLSEITNTDQRTDGDEHVIDSDEPVLTADDKRFALGQTWLDKACEVYSMPPVKLAHEPWRYTTVYTASPDDNTPAFIEMPDFKIVSLFAAFAEHRGDNSMSKAGQNPTGFAYSLYYSVRPRMFRRMVREGRFPGVNVRDLYRSKTWEKIQAHRLDPNRPDVLSLLARIDAGEDVVGSTEILGAADEAAAMAELASEVDMDRLRALSSKDDGEDEWEDAVDDLEPEVVEPKAEQIEEPEVVSESGVPLETPFVTIEGRGTFSQTQLEECNRDVIRAIARELGILNPSSKTKPELVSLILATGTGVTA